MSRRWAKKHHPRWYREVERQEAKKESCEGLKSVTEQPALAEAGADQVMATRASMAEITSPLALLSYR